MNAAGIPTPNNAGVRPVFPSICSQKKPIEFFWFQTDVAADLEEAFEEYVAPQFESDYAAAMAEEEFLDTIDRAKKVFWNLSMKLRKSMPKRRLRKESLK